MFAATHQQLEDTVLQIAAAIEQSVEVPTASLLGGKAGHALFYGHLYQCLGREKDFELFSLKLHECVEWLAAEPTDATLSRGFGGLMWVVQHFIRVGLLDESAADILAELNGHLEASLAADALCHSYDMLHGLVGKGLYFLERLPDPGSLLILNKMVDQLASFATVQAGGLSWPDPMAPTPDTYNLGMAHGVPSVIGFLAKAHAGGVAPAQTRHLLEQSVGWLLGQESPTGHSRYPNSTARRGYQSRLAWCYGDLGPALALFHAARALDRPDWRDQAVALARHAGQRTLETAGLNRHTVHGWHDTSFCHGAAGLAHLFNRFYQATQLEEFRQVAQYWLLLSGPTLPPGQGMAGYMQFDYDAERKSIAGPEDASLLSGAAGVGLVLLSFFQPQQPAWDGIFMTDI